MSLFIVVFIAVVPSAAGAPIETLVETRRAVFSTPAVCKAWADTEAAKFKPLPKGWRVRGECRPAPQGPMT
jgi:hypothetical protein